MMTDRFLNWLRFPLFLGLALVATPHAAVARENESDSSAALLSSDVKPVIPGPADGRIAFMTARLLEQLHYLRQPFDASVSSKFLDRYLDTLDPQHMHFLQSDIAEFEKYRTNLHTLTLSRRGVADTAPGFVIFNCFLARLDQRVKFVDETLKSAKFTFDLEERIAINREDLPYPKDIEDARKLWKERLRYEYLQERLGKLTAKKKPELKKEDSKGSSKDVATSETKPKSEAEEITATLANRYHRNLKTFKDFDNNDVLQFYLTALTHVYDPHSDYLGQSQLDSFSIGMNLSLFGIGAELRSLDGYCTINRLLPGGPASKSKLLKEKDRIVAVAQSNQPPVDVVDMNLNKAVQLIRGPKGSEVRLTIVPTGEDSSSRKVITLIRDEIPLEDQAAKAKIIETPGAEGATLRLGVIDLPSFYASFDPTHVRGKSEPKSTTTDVAKLIQKLKEEKVAGLILDLRRNGGGSLEEAIRLTGLFIKQGPVVQVRDFEGSVQEDADGDPAVLYDGPLIVLTSRFSASASEIVAGALQDYGRAVLVGDLSTHGKGTVQSVNPLRPYMQLYSKGMTNEPGALKITIKKFYRASGASTQLKGVSPDIVLPSIFNESRDFGESSLENPLPWDTIKTATYEHMDRVAPYVDELRRRSQERIERDPEFAYIKEDIELYKKHQSDKTVSLNEKQLLQEKGEADARKKVRDKERLAREDKNTDKVYEITLKLAETKGLPPPVERTNTLAKITGAAATTGAAVSASAEIRQADPADDDGTDEDDELKPAAVDPAMTEAQHILIDYLGVLRGSDVAWSIKP